LAKRSRLSVHTIRYYEAIGLLPCPGRDQSGKRSYDASILAWIDFIARLKAAEMPIKEMICYADLWQRGPANAEAVKAGYASPEYAQALKVRDKALRRNLICVEGVAAES
jgi:DNA-binding transcriptional MerR regulator